MPRQARANVIDPKTIQVVRCVQHCVRFASLLGNNPITGEDCSIRKEWVRERIKVLIPIFAIDCLTYSVHCNQIQVVLRSRPDKAKSWSDKEVAKHWLTLFPKRRDEHGNVEEPTKAEIAALTKNKTALKVKKSRLSCISWWVRCLSEP
ncbi:hypothetical protein NHH03_15090, partial [Stieleria sp. TO1_6]|nr:hypothetical protein [Stieleria tagensis]